MRVSLVQRTMFTLAPKCVLRRAKPDASTGREQRSVYIWCYLHEELYVELHWQFISLYKCRIFAKWQLEVSGSNPIAVELN